MLQQKKKRQTCLSKALGLYARIEWGLRDVKILSPFSFSAIKETETFSFRTHQCDHDESMDVYLPEFNEQFIIVFIPNKKADNCILMRREDCLGSMASNVTMKWLASKILKKWRVNLKEISGT